MIQKGMARFSPLTFSGWRFFCVIILLGIFFRCVNIENKIYWVDEVVTSIHIAGYTQKEVFSEISHKKIISLSDLQKYQKLDPKKDFFTTLESFKENPEHAPLYFILTYFWVKLFGNSIVAIRSLSVVFSLLALPCFYWLCIELFDSSTTGLIGAAFLSISPFFVSYGQEARPYSLWLVTLLLSNITLLRAIRLGNRTSWFLYTLCLIVSYYTFLFSIVVTFGQMVYVAILARLKLFSRFDGFLSCCIISLVAFSPWLIIIIQNLQIVNNNTQWMRETIPFLAKIAIWFYGISSVFIETPIYKTLDFLILMRIFFDINLSLILSFSIYFLVKNNFKTTGIFILCMGFIYAFILAFVDLLFQGQGSTPPRYMIPLYLGLQLSLTNLLSHKVFSLSVLNYKEQRFWKIALVGIFSISIMSCAFNLDRSPRYQKSRNLYNIPIANIVNQAKAPLVFSEQENILDIISLSYHLKKEVKFEILSDFSLLSSYLCCERELFLFNPSPRAIAQIQQAGKVDINLSYKPELFIHNELYLSIWQVNKLVN